ncbi:hypothetical protein [Pedobacter xixiisoli]|uniref:Uncharacterized protein n=1 Tax=Pedobacter xixiisoli TaxID=1476464 RepID=A0A286AAS4_9SPHI|nr:hypothetical protein [Pedobacter xixiisoli]SOD19000.1 hypothetical protein SAMN06297358_3295 [Pedobacter xixiisoli]
MKKFLAVLVIVFLANLGCKKLDDKQGVCACSPIYEPTVVLVVKNAAGTDMLNPATAGYFANNNIQLYYLEGSTQKKLNFYVRPSFSYGNEKFNYYQLNSSDIIRQSSTSNKDIYFKLGEDEPMKLNLELVADKKYQVAKLLVDGKEAVAEKGNVTSYLQNIFYVSL